MPQSDIPAETSIEWIRDFEERFLEAWNSHQADRVLALMTEDIEYRDDHWPKTMRGHPDAREALDAYWTAFPDLTFEIIEGPVRDPRSATLGGLLARYRDTQWPVRPPWLRRDRPAVAG